MLVINLSKTDTGHGHTATCDGISYTHSRKDPIPPVCRRLIDKGHPPETLVIVCRNDRLVFKPLSLGAWSKHDVVDDDNRGLIRRRYRPRPDFQGRVTMMPSETQEIVMLAEIA